MNKFRLVLVFTFLVALSACGSSGGASGDGEVTELRYQGSVGAVTPPELAEDLGYLGKVKLKWVGNTISGPQDIQSAATGQTDFGGAFNGAVIKLVAAKAPIKAVISYYGSDKDAYNGYYVLDGSPIKTARDLIGKKIAVNTLGAHHEAVIKEYLKRAGLTKEEIKQVELVVTPPVNTEQALRQKQIDVGTLGGILRDKALERGGIHPLFTDYELLGAFNAGTYVLRDDFIAKNPATTRTFVTGVAKAIEWSKTHPRDEVVARFKSIIAKRKRSEDATAIGYWKSYGVSAKGGLIGDKDFQTWIDWLQREGELQPGQVKLSDLYTNSFNSYANGSAQ
ncbi:ABC transporter substrate-binding protein [Planotetraspora sp. A-T 1434]|uniref:ABC transporter substrate-binding protein n=1 Tax=Planotetraspora sp. A-T 1434 TaxID=2979219 RepID=UPI0021C0E29A|nr:ABC transporter substrate-binding protein [Planotetraspora sp. A-T 1434]MCT9931292.1 ABC transporter substrate-binding protein [Planotetraspora sp. A-T 1434]